jgi:hypothetical protein
MAKARNQWEVDARAMAERIERAAELGQQLTFLPDEVPGEGDQGEGGAVGRPAGARNKASSQMRDWLAARGFRLPEEVLVQMAGLDAQEDAVLVAMARTERILAWAFDVGEDVPLPKGTARVATPAKRLEVFMQVFTIQLRAAEAMMPYGAAKASPDISVTQRTTIVMPGAAGPADPAASARDVTPRSDGRMRPPPLPGEMQRNQGVADAAPAMSDARGRTE